MRFLVTGTDHATSARKIIEVEAANRAAAEKQAQLQGMTVQHVQPVVDSAEPATPPRVTHRGEFPERSGRGKWILLVLLVLVLATALVWWLRWGTAAGS